MKIVEREKLRKEAEEEKALVIGLGFCGTFLGANAAVTDVKDGKIVRIRPLHYDWKYEAGI